jgi:periplasmic protein TonB
MPQELLRDVLRTGDASSRARRRLSVLPVTIAVHVVVIGMFVVTPILTGGDLPVIASAVPYFIRAAAPPPAPPPPPSASTVAPRSNVAPREAPHTIPPVEVPPAPPAGPRVEGGDNLTVQTGDAAGLLNGANFSAPPTALPPAPPETPKVVRVGGLIKEPRKLVHVPPVYPTMAQQTHVQGTVTLEALIDVTGRVQNVKVLSSDHPLLNGAAMQAVQQWRYTPTELNGVPVPVLMTIFVRFTLER